ncbi:hypothetical protein EPIB1_2010 [Tritonibacter mobilis]|nr:hypothetical protein EPIB1_2010 [Tritonibacter mobilis]
MKKIRKPFCVCQRGHWRSCSKSPVFPQPFKPVMFVAAS